MSEKIDIFFVINSVVKSIFFEAWGKTIKPENHVTQLYSQHVNSGVCGTSAFLSLSLA